MNSDETEIFVEIFSETGLAIQVENLKGKRVWIPKSQIIDFDHDLLEERKGNIFIPEWLAMEKDLI